MVRTLALFDAEILFVVWSGGTERKRKVSIEAEMKKPDFAGRVYHRLFLESEYQFIQKS